MTVNAVLAVAAAVQIGVVAIWLLQHVAMNRIRRLGLRVPIRPASPELAELSVIVPARNEAVTIGECVRAVLSQDYPRLKLLLVDDRSTDDTAGVAMRAAEGDPRMTVTRIDALPPDWLGKSHALWTAARQSDTPWLLFVDADCRVLPHGLSSAVQFAQARGAEMLSLWPRDGSVGFWERLLVPLCGAMIVIWYGRAAADGSATPTAFANGQFLLVRRDLYMAIGGHQSVRAALIEDIPLARLAKAQGGRVLSAIGADICSVRMYRSLGELVRGWRRIYIGVLTPAQIGLCMASIVIGSLTPYVVLPAVWNRWWAGDGGWWRLFGSLSLLHLAALMLTSVRFFSLARCKLRYLWLYPLSCLGVLGILASAWIGRLGRTTINWRGTTYRVQDSSIKSN